MLHYVKVNDQRIFITIDRRGRFSLDPSAPNDVTSEQCDGCGQDFFEVAVMDDIAQTTIRCTACNMRFPIIEV